MAMREIASSLIALSNDKEQYPPHKCGARGAYGAELHDLQQNRFLLSKDHFNQDHFQFGGRQPA